MLTYNMDERGDESLYEYLYRCVRRDIETGAIAAGQRLPSKRALAKNLGVSLITVEGAYDQLVAEGYVYALPRKGYYACALTGGVRGGEARGMAGASNAAGFSSAVFSAPSTSRVAAAPSIPAGAAGFADPADPAGFADPADPSEPALLADFTGRTAPHGLFPYAIWAKTVREVLTRESEDTLMAETLPAGSPRLRVELARYLRAFRGMDVDPARIVVGAGAQVLYNFIVQLLGRQVGYAVETPGYPRLTKIYRANDVLLAHVPLDADGVRVDELRASGADVLHIMPSHQFPTGQVTSVSRRYELLGWAAEKPGRVIVEDDYDCEFRLSGRPIPALASIDALDCVIYTNTFAKSLGPAFRIGYMVLPERLARRFDERLGFYSCTVSTVEQLALARFMENGDYERHVNRSRAYYRQVRNDLVEALRACPAADRLNVEVTDAGLHFLLGVRGPAGGAGTDDEALVAAARRRGVALAPLARYYPEQDRASGEGAGWFVMNYSSLTKDSVAPAVEALSDAVRESAL